MLTLSPRFISAIFLGIAVNAFAAFPTYAADADTQTWAQFVVNKRFDKVRLFAELQPRSGNNNDRLFQFIARPAVGYMINPRMSVWLGYGWTPSFIPEFNNEHRMFQQFLIEDSFAHFSLNNRTRLEERFIEGAGDTSIRLRHLVRLYKPLDGKKRWGAVGYDELFWNLNSTPRGPQSGFDQNRVFLGVSNTIDRHTRIEAGYLASFVNPPRHRPDRRFDVLMVTVNYNL